MKLSQGLVLMRVFNLSDVKVTALMRWDVQYPGRASFVWLCYMFKVVDPWSAVQELTTPALQSLLPKLIFLLYVKMHATKWKMGMIPFYLDLNIFLLCIRCLFFNFKFESETFGSSRAIPVSAAAWLRVGVGRWHEVALCRLSVTFCRLVHPWKCDCTAAHTSTPFFPVGFPFMKPFLWILPWRANSLQGRKGLSDHLNIIFLFGLGGCSFPSRGLGFLPPTQWHSWHCYVPLFLLGHNLFHNCSCFIGEMDLASL